MSAIDRLIRRAIRSWAAWRTERRLSRAIPNFSVNRARLEQLKRSHKSQQPVLRDMREAMTEALRDSISKEQG